MVTDGQGFKYGNDLFGNKMAIFEAARKKKTKKQERGEMFRFFMERLNPGRKEAGYTPLTEARLGYILQGIRTSDLYALQSKCEKAKSFSKTFWWEIDPKKHGNLPA